MNTRSALLGSALLLSSNLGYGVVFSGYTGHLLDGVVEVSPYYIYSTISPAQNVSNLGSPLAVVNAGTEFSSDFDDTFGQLWHLTADVQDNYQVTLRETSPLSQANIGAGDWMVRWHFSGFDFQVGGVQQVAGPIPTWQASIVSYDANNVWIGFHHLYEVPEQGTYTFQIIPVPEPMTAVVGVLGAAIWLLARKARKFAG